MIFIIYTSQIAIPYQYLNSNQNLYNLKEVKMPKADPIQLLRNAYNQNLEKRSSIKLKGKDLHFQKDIKLPLDTQTAWVSTQSNKHYNLGSLWLYLESHFKKIDKTQYFKKVTELGLEKIGIIDVPEITKYFSGQTNESECINNQLRQTLNNKSKRQKPAAGFQENEDNPEKKVKSQFKLDEATQQMIKCIDYLNTFQKPINSKSKCLRYTQKKFINILTHIIENQGQTMKPKNAENAQGKLRIASFYQKKKVPIIIVPEKTIPGNVSLQNIEKFLQQGEYDQYAKLSNPDVSKLQLQRIIKGKNITFQINSRPQLLSEKDWQYVVAVFALGRENQFDHWPYKAHKKVFENSLGYFLKFPKSVVGPVSEWKCKIINLDQNSRLMDKQVVKSIWEDIQKFIFAKI